MNDEPQRNRAPIGDETVHVRASTIARTTEGSSDTNAIRTDIENTRAEMSETINALQDRLSPSALKEQAQDQFEDIKDQVKEQVREQFQEARAMVRDATIGRIETMVNTANDTVTEARYTMMDTIRENPVPAALVGIGLGWLFMNRSSRTPVRYSGRGSVRGDQRYRQPDLYNNTAYAYDDRRGSDNSGMMERGRQAVGGAYDRAQASTSQAVDRTQQRASSVAHTVGDTASGVASSVSDTASNVADRTRETAGDLVEQAQYQAHRVEDRFQNTMRENPLAVGAVALALGAAVGLTLPQTERENELMGETRDHLVDRAQEATRDTMEKVQRVASDVADETKQSVQRAASEITDETKQTVMEQSRQQGLTS